MEYLKIKQAMDSGALTIVAHKDKLDLITKQYDVYTGQEIDPTIEFCPKVQLQRDIKKIVDQISKMQDTKVVVKRLLDEFSKESPSMSPSMSPSV
jgi:hypothetical protein